MAPSFLRIVGAATLALAASVNAAGLPASQSYKVAEVYDSTNFFDKFNFVTAADPNSGFVEYQSRADAKSLGLISTQGGDNYIGVDYKNMVAHSSGGRKSVRLESKNVYNGGSLIIADFTHLPKPTCGSWPAFWFFGEPWPTKGEIDIYENWNDLTFNRHSSHVDGPDKIGECKIAADGISAKVDSHNCYDLAPGQLQYQGCSASSKTPTFGNPSGGIFALEWTSEYLKVWDWTHEAAPADIKAGRPSPAAWGKPAYAIKECDVPKAFKDMKMVLNVDFCAVAGQDDKWSASCKASTEFDTCKEYVAAKPGDFEKANFKVKDIKVYTVGKGKEGSSSLPSPSPSHPGSSHSSSVPAGSSDYPTASFSHGSDGQTYPVSSDSFSAAATHYPGVYPTASYPGHNASASPYPVNREDDDFCEDDEDDDASPYPSASATAPSGGLGSNYPVDHLSASVTSTSGGSYPSDHPYVTGSASAGPEMTTSTIYSTTVYTVTSCAPTVTNCPASGYVTTKIVPVGTTVCPVGEVSSTESHPQVTTYPAIPGGYTTTMEQMTRTYTITECAPGVQDCSIGSITSEVSVTTTVYPIGEGGKVLTTYLAAIPTTTSKPVGVANYPETEAKDESAPSESAPAAVFLEASVSSNSPVQTYPVVGGDDSGKDKVVATATIVPVKQTPDVVANGHNAYNVQNATLLTAAAPQGTGSYVGNTNNNGYVSVNGGIRSGVSFSLMGAAAFLFFAM